jgi:hypothetical protein
MAPSLLTAQDQINIRIVSGVYCAIAVLFTAARFWVRGKNLWWDDWCALVALVGTLGAKGCQIAVTYGVMRTSGPGPVSAKIALNYILALTYVLELWFSRVSILYSVIRITPFHRWVKRMQWLPLFFALSALTYLFLFIGYCESAPAWKQSTLVLCFVRKHVSYYQIATAFIADAVIIILPIFVLRLLTSLPWTRLILMLLFGASILLTVAQIIQTTMTLRQVTGSIFASLTVGFAAVVMCNLPVVVMATIELFTGSKEVVGPRPRFQLTNELGFRTSFTEDSATKPEQQQQQPSPSDSDSDVKAEAKE